MPSPSDDQRAAAASRDQCVDAVSGRGPGPGATDDPAFAGSRRLFLLAGLALLAGCSTTEQIATAPAPEPRTMPPAPPPRTMPSTPPPAPAPAPRPSAFPNVLPREVWARGAPDHRQMNRMTAITHITIHHDAMSLFTATDAESSRARIELIRRSHRGKDWADIGYHFVVDRAGRVYEGRPIAWQGAHVKNHNEGNIGILCLGNFEVQMPSDAQLEALATHVRLLRQRYGVPTRCVRTHREWAGAKTLCPGAHLQRRVVSLRSNHAFA